MKASNHQTKKADNWEDSQEESKKKPSSLSTCLSELKTEWNKNKKVAALWQDWGKIAGHKLSAHCKPLTFQGGVLTVGAQHPQWRQALIFNRNQLIAALRAQGHTIKDLRVKQYHPQKQILKKEEHVIWAKHPSRWDIHGKTICPICNAPSPAGEISLWRKCGLCRRKDLSN